MSLSGKKILIAGAGVSGILLLVTLKKINRTETDSEDLDTVSGERAGDGDEDR